MIFVVFKRYPKVVPKPKSQITKINFKLLTLISLKSILKLNHFLLNELT